MKCSKCKAEFEDGSLFCPECGNPVESGAAGPETNFCPNCGSAVEGGAVFCEACGFKLEAAQTAAPAEQAGPPKKKNLTLALGIGAAVVAVAAGAMIAPALRSGGAEGSSVMYLKDGGMWNTRMIRTEIQTRE